MSQNPSEPSTPEAKHLEVEQYDEGDRIEPPEWYDDTINVGEEANRE